MELVTLLGAASTTSVTTSTAVGALIRTAPRLSRVILTDLTAHREPHHSHYPHHHDAGYGYQRRPQVIYVRKEAPYDYRRRLHQPVVRDSRNTVIDKRNEVLQGRDQLRDDRAELKKDRAELRRDIRNHASKDEIRSDRQEIRADLQKIKSTRQEVHNDRRELARR